MQNLSMHNALAFIKQMFEKRYLLSQLVKRDFTSKYVDSYLGLAWAILEPLATAVILSLIFSYGFKAGTLQSIPFFLYMFSGMVAYNFFSMALGEGTNVIRTYSFLVKKVDFQLSLLPLMKNISCSFFHLIMLMLLIIILLFYGYFPSMYWIQFIYYFLCMNFLVLGLTWFTSALTVFIPDISRVVAIILQFLFYASPIFWSYKDIPTEWASILKLNPMSYVINGYRDSFINSKPFWHYPGETIFFWSFSLSCLFFGIYVFRKLRPQFADVI